MRYDWARLKKEFLESKTSDVKRFMADKGIPFSRYVRRKTAKWNEGKQQSADGAQELPQERLKSEGLAAKKRRVAMLFLDSIMDAIENNRAGLFTSPSTDKGEVDGGDAQAPEINHDNARKLATTLKAVFELAEEQPGAETASAPATFITAIYGKPPAQLPPHTVCFNPAFAEANITKARYRVFKGGAGSGKSVNVAQDYILKLMNPAYKGSNLLVIRKSDATNRYSTFAELTSAINRIGVDEYWTVRQNPLSLECSLTGANVLFRGVHNGGGLEKLKSINFPRGKLTWVWLEEATELSQTDLEIIDDRLRGELGNPNMFYQITLTFNPVSASHWLKGRFFDHPNADVFTHHSTYLDNLFIDEGYKRRMERRKELDPDGYRVYALGEWGEAGGLILTNWETREISADWRDYDSAVLAQDFGYNHANAILLVGFKDDEIYVIDELYTYEKTAGEILSMAEAKFPKQLVMWCDSAEPDKIREWQMAGWAAYPVKKGEGSVLAQIDYLKRHKLIINPACVNTQKEISQWKWALDHKTGKYTDRPVPFMDDAMSALRYSVEEMRRYGVTR